MRFAQIPFRRCFLLKVDESSRRSRHGAVLIAAALVAAFFVEVVVADVVADACSTWLDLKCSSYAADTAVNAYCDMSNATLSGNPHSFDTSQRVTNPRGSLTFCSPPEDPNQPYRFTVSSQSRYTIKSIVTMVGFIPQASLLNVTHDAPFDITTVNNATYRLGSFVPGFNGLIGSQQYLNFPPGMRDGQKAYPFNGIITCVQSVAYQVWKIPQAILDAGIKEIRIYDRAQVAKVYSITLDTCGTSYSALPFASYGAPIFNSTLRASNSTRPLKRLQGLIWPLCLWGCMTQQDPPCKAYIQNITSQECVLLGNAADLVSSVNENNTNWTVVPPVSVGTVPEAVGLAMTDVVPTTSPMSAFDGAKLVKPMWYGGLRRTLVFGYLSEKRVIPHFSVSSTNRFAVAISAGEMSGENFAAVWAGGRMSQCGEAPRAVAEYGPQPLNASLYEPSLPARQKDADCLRLTYCTPQALSQPLTGFISIALQLRPWTCQLHQNMSWLALISNDGSVNLGGAYFFVQFTNETSDIVLKQSLGAFHLVATSSVQVQYLEVLPAGTTGSPLQQSFSNIALYRTSSGPAMSAAPQWFWSDADRKSYNQSVFCQLQTRPGYLVVANYMSLPQYRYNCNSDTLAPFSTIFSILTACNNDANCVGFTTVVLANGTEAAGCLLNSTDTSDTSGQQANYTTFLKNWLEDTSAFRCTFPVYSASMVRVAVAIGAMSGSVAVYADGTLLAQCAMPQAAIGEDSCWSFQSCFSGTIPALTSNLVVMYSPVFPLQQQCSLTLLQTLVSFDLDSVRFQPSVNCVQPTTPTSCTGLGLYSSPQCQGGRLAANVTIPGSYCDATDGITAVPSVSPAAAMSVITVTDFSAVPASVVGGATFLITGEAGGRRTLLGYLVHDKATNTTQTVPVATSPMPSSTFCVSAVNAGPNSNFNSFPVPLTFAQLTSVVARGPQLRVVSSTIIGTATECGASLIVTQKTDQMFRHVLPGASFTGLTYANVKNVSVWTQCALLCYADRGNCSAYTHYADLRLCALRNGVGAVVPVTSGRFAVTSGVRSLARTYTRAYSANTAGGTDFPSMVKYMFDTYGNAFIFASANVSSFRFYVDQFSTYQLALAQTGFASDGYITSTTYSNGGGQTCGPQFEPYEKGSDFDGQCDTFALCPPMQTQVTSLLASQVTVSATTSSTMSRSACANLAWGLFSSNGLVKTSASYASIALIVPATGFIAPSSSSSVADVLNMTYLGSPTTAVFYSTASDPAELSLASSTSMCQLKTKLYYQVVQRTGVLSSSTDKCGVFSSLDSAIAGCSSDEKCTGVTVDGTTGLPACLTSTTSTVLSLQVFLKKVASTTCRFRVAYPGLLSISISKIGVSQSSGSDVVVLKDGAQVGRCGATRPFTSGYVTDDSDQCDSFLECYSDLALAIGFYDVVFPITASRSNMDAMQNCSYDRAAIAVLTPQRTESLQYSFGAGTLPNRRTVRFGTQTALFNIVLQQSQVSRVAVLVKQDRFACDQSNCSTPYVLTLSVGSTPLQLCGGNTAGFSDGPGLSGQCAAFYNCGPTSQYLPSRIPSLSGAVQLAAIDRSILSTIFCGNKFEATILTDGLLLSSSVSRANYRSFFVLWVDVMDPVGLLTLQSNLSNLVALNYSSSINASRSVLYRHLFPYRDVLTSQASANFALVDDLSTFEERKTLTNGTWACIVDGKLDSTMPNSCEIFVQSNYISVKIPQTKYDAFDNIVTILINNTVLATCGGDHLFAEFRGIAGACNNYFHCFEGFIPANSTVTVVFADSVVTSAACAPSAMAIIEASVQLYVPPSVCNNLAAPFACQADQRCMPLLVVCDGKSDCSSSADESRCDNWRLVAAGIEPVCAPKQSITSISHDDCIKFALVYSANTFYLTDDSTCYLYDCLVYTSPSLQNSSFTGKLFIYTSDPSSFAYCTDELHCNSNGVVSGTASPCLCQCSQLYTGDSCDVERHLGLIDAISAVFSNATVTNVTTAEIARATLATLLPLGTTVLTQSILESNTSSQIVTFYLRTILGGSLSDITLQGLLSYTNEAKMMKAVPGLEYVSAAPMIGFSDSVHCLLPSITPGVSCTGTAYANISSLLLVTVSGISFTSPSQFVDILLDPPGEVNQSFRCNPSDFVQYQDLTQSGACGYVSVCAKQANGSAVTKIIITPSPLVNPTGSACRGNVFTATARVLGQAKAISSNPTGASSSNTYDSSLLAAFLALLVTGVVFSAVLLCWCKTKKKFPRFRQMGPVVLALMVIFLFAALCVLGLYVASRTVAFTHYVVIQEFRDSSCEQSAVASIPLRVSIAPAQIRSCANLVAVGAPEGAYYLSAAVGNMATDNITLFVSGSEYLCNTDPSVVSVAPGKCVKENVLFPDKIPLEQNFVTVTVLPASEALQYINYVASFAPYLPLSTAVPVIDSTIGQVYNRIPGDYTYYSAGRRFQVPAPLGNFLLPNVSTQNVTTPIVDPSRQHVRFIADIVVAGSPTESTQYLHFNSTPYVVQSYATTISDVGTYFNGFRSGGVEYSGPYATTSFLYYNVIGTNVDQGSFLRSSVQFWVQASNATRGFALALIDGWISANSQNSPLLSRLLNIVENTETHVPWFKEWNCYYAVYLNGVSGTISFLVAGANGVNNLVWDLQQIGAERLFDGKWHFVTFTIDNSVNNHAVIQLFVDGQTGTVGWEHCLKNNLRSVRVLGKGAPAPVQNALQESVTDGGILVLGLFNGGLYNVAFGGKQIELEQILLEGASGMENYQSIAAIESLGLGLVTLAFVAVVVFISLYQMVKHFLSSTSFALESEESDDDAALDKNPEDDELEAATGSASVPLWEFVQPVFIVVQSMALYYYAWDWPTSYTDTYFGVFSLLSFDLSVMTPQVWLFSWPILQWLFALAILAIVIVGVLIDNERFKYVVAHYKEILHIRGDKLGINKKSAKAMAAAAAASSAVPGGKVGTLDQGVKAKDDSRPQPRYYWVKHLHTGPVRLTMDEEAILVKHLHTLLARRDRHDSNIRVSTKQLVELGDLGRGIIIYERTNKKVAVSFRRGDTMRINPTNRDQFEVMQVPLECVSDDNTQCPDHKHALVPDDMMQYTCVHSGNLFYRNVTCRRNCIMYHCPSDLCDYAVCEFCYTGSSMDSIHAMVKGKLQALQKIGFASYVGLFTVVCVSLIYLPAIKYALMVLVCHPLFQCEFGNCWVDLKLSYIIFAIFAAGALLVIGIGYLASTSYVVLKRMLTLRKVLPSVPIKRKGVMKLLAGLLPKSKVKRGIYFDYLKIDNTILRAIYSPFEFQHLWAAPATLLYKLVIAIVVLVTARNSLTQLTLAVAVETIFALIFYTTMPCKNIWIDLLWRFGSMHQLVQLGLMSLHRVVIRSNPKGTGYAHTMSVLTFTYIGCIGALLMAIVVVPTAQRMYEARQKKQQEALGDHEIIDVGFWGRPGVSSSKM